jgi:hypothetical protein
MMPIVLLSPNPQQDGRFGTSIAVDTVVAVGALGETVNGLDDAGRTYTYNSTTGGLLATLTSPNPQLAGGFGWSVATLENTVVVGAPSEAVNGFENAGRAYMFNALTGSLIRTLMTPNPQPGGTFGQSVSVAAGAINNIVAVGAPNELVPEVQQVSGNAYTFNAMTGALLNTFTSPNPQFNGLFGSTVAVLGNTLAVGAPNETVSELLEAGRVYVFNALTGSLIITLTSPHPQVGGNFGASVALSNEFIIVGAPSEAVENPGRVYIFNA